MAKYAHVNVLDNGLLYLKNNVISMRLLSSWTAGQDLVSEINAATLANVTMTSTDFVISGADGASRVLTTASGKSVNASASGGSATNHIAFCDATNVLWVTSETSGQAVVSGNPVNFPSLTYTSPQPV